MSRNSITPSRAFFTIFDLVNISGGSPFGPGRRSRTPMAHEATGFGGPPFTSIRHMRQLPAIDRRSWKQKRGISAPAASHACSSVYSAGTSISLIVDLDQGHSAYPHLWLCQSFMCSRCDQSNAKSLLPCASRCFSRSSASASVGMCPSSTNHMHEMVRLQLLEPFGLAVVEALVNGLPDERLELLDRFPHAHVDRHRRIGKRPHVECVAAGPRRPAARRSPASARPWH